MHNFGRVTSPVQRLAHRFRQHYRAMASPRAAERDCQITLPLTNIVRDQISQQSLDAPQELPGLRKRADITGHARIAPGKFAQLGNEMRIRQKAHVEDEVGVGWYTILVTEAHQGTHDST